MIEGYDLVTKLFHMGERIRDDFSRPVPPITDASQLAGLNIFEQFKNITQEIIKTDDGEIALLGRRVLEDILLPQYPRMRQTNPELYLDYQKLIALLKFMNLPAYGLREISKIVKENLISAMQLGLLVKEKFQRVLRDYDDALMEGSIADELGNAMMACEEKLGENPILGSDNKMKPQTVSYWLNDYIQEGLSGAEHKTGSIERISYLQRNRNAQQLNGAEKKILSEIFRLYDWLKYGEEVSEEETRKIGGVGGLSYMNAQKANLPQGIVSQPKLTPAEIAPPLKIFAPQPKPASIPEKNFSDVLAQRPPAPRMTTPPPSVPLTAQPPRQPAPGVVFAPRPSISPPPNLPPQGGGKREVEDIRQIRKEIEEKKQQAQRQIEKKLEELKRKTGNNP